jgi:hypothetical protein
VAGRGAAVSAGAQRGARDARWRWHRGDLGSTKSAPLDQITRINVSKRTDHRQNSSELNFAPTPARIHRMLELVIVAVRAFTLALRGHRELVLENLALRQQLAAFHRTTRCRLRSGDRLRPQIDQQIPHPRSRDGDREPIVGRAANSRRIAHARR